MKRLDLVANIAVVVASVALLSFIGTSWYEAHHRQPASVTKARALVGSTVQLAGVDFSATDKTLLIAISSSCHFCKLSEPFYRQLSQSPVGTAKLVAVLPMTQSDATTYVHTSISPSLEVVSSSLNAIGVHSTPTLLLVDHNGRVMNAWVGKLDDAGQKQVQSQL